MDDEKPEYYSIHDEMQDLVFGRKKNIVNQSQSNTNELDDIRKALKHILDIVTNINRFIRSSQYCHKGKIYDGEEYEKEAVKSFLGRLRDGVASEDDKKLFASLLSQKPKPREIE